MSTHPLVHEAPREGHTDDTLHAKNLATGPEANKERTTAQTNPTIVPPPSHGNPAVTSAGVTGPGNVATSSHPAAAGPHPPVDATHNTEKVIPVPNAPVSGTAPSNRLKQLERGELTILTDMLQHSYSNKDTFIVIPTTEEDDPHHPHHQAHNTQTSGDKALAKDVKKDQENLDKLKNRSNYVFKKIARALLKRNAAWGLHDHDHSHIVAAALFVPPARNPSQNANQLRLEDPKINEGQASHYVPLAKLFTKKNPKQLVLLGPSLIKRVRLELRLFDTAMTVHQRPDVGFLYFFGDLKTGLNNRDSSGPADQALTQHQNPQAVIAGNTDLQNHHANTLLQELGKQYPMQVTAERYRDNKRFLMLLQNGFQEIDKVQGFRERYAEGEAKVIAPGIGEKKVAHGEKGPDHVYESCFLSLVRGIYPSLKNEENDVRGVVAQKQADGVISDPKTVLPPAHV
jgi:hypothetical protein